MVKSSFLRRPRLRKMDKSWMYVTDRFRSTEYAQGVRQFQTMARAHAAGNNTARCPCRRCCNNLFLPISEVEEHLFITGIDSNYTEWIFHGETESLNFNVTDEDDEDNGDDCYMDDFDDMLGDIYAATCLGVHEDPTTHSGSCTFVEPEPTTFEHLA